MNHLPASSRFLIPSGAVSYRYPRLFCAEGLPLLAAMRYHRIASLIFCSTPLPNWYAKPSCSCACMSPEPAFFVNLVKLIWDDFSFGEETYDWALAAGRQDTSSDNAINVSVPWRLHFRPCFGANVNRVMFSIIVSRAMLTVRPPAS